MIHRSLNTWQVKSWQESLQSLITRPEALLDALALDETWLKPAQKAANSFPLRVTESFLRKMRKADPSDPLLRQVLPLHLELEQSAQYTADPLQESDFSPMPGVIHKYRSRVLFVAATQCAINCRYCFRRHFPYQESKLNKQQWHAAISYVKSKPEVDEVILSGGDPMTLPDSALRWLVSELAQLDNIQTVRIHSRLPLVLPERFTRDCIDAISHEKLKTVFVIHSNHAQEIDTETARVAADLRAKDITLLNQSVLLKGINDSAEDLAKLSKALFQINVSPYYLHMLDRVAGAAHFAISEQNAKEIYQELLALLPGYLVPKLVKEIPCAQSKTPISP